MVELVDTIEEGRFDFLEPSGASGDVGVEGDSEISGNVGEIRITDILLCFCSRLC